MLDLPEKLLQDAYNEYGETIELRNELLNQLKEKLSSLSEEDKLIIDLSDNNLIKYLRFRKFNLDRSYDTIINWIKFHKDNDNLFSNVSAEEFELFNNCFQILEPDLLGRIIVIFNVKNFLDVLTPDLIAKNPLLIQRSQYYFYDQLSNNLHVQVNGVVIIQNFQDLSFWNQIRLSRLINFHERALFIKYIRDCLGMRMKGFITVNEPMLIHILAGFILNFFKDKTKSRFLFCGNDYSKIKEIITDISILPSRLGGTV